MNITLSPQRRDDTLFIERNGDKLTLNGEEFDFSKIAEGDTLPGLAIASDWFLGDVNRIDGELHLTIILPNSWDASHEQRFPEPLMGVLDGVVALP